jgi:uncharacterized delta-60 repeat protein
MQPLKEREMNPFQIFLLTISLVFYSLVWHASASTLAYVSNADSNSISVLDTETNQIINTIALSASPNSLVVHPDGERAYFVSAGSLSVIDLKTNTVVDSLTFNHLGTGIAMHPSGGFLYITNLLSDGTAYLVTVDTESFSIFDDTLVIGRGNLADASMVINKAGTTLYTPRRHISDIIAVDLATLMINAVFETNSGVFYLAVHPDGSKLFASNNTGPMEVFDTASRDLIDTIEMQSGARQSGVIVHPNGQKAYVVSGDELNIIDTFSNIVIDALNVASGSQNVAIHPDGSRLYVASYTDDSLSVIDTDTNTVIATLAVGEFPDDIAIGPASIAGSVSGISTALATCKNIDTGQIVRIQLDETQTTWDCETAGLTAEQGDQIVLLVDGEITATAEDGQLDCEFADLDDGIKRPCGTLIVGNCDSEFPYDLAKAIVIQADGKLLVAGVSCSEWGGFFLRLNADGSVDSTFAESGFVTEGPGEILTILQQADSKILALSDNRLARYHAHGSLDKSFASDGYLDLNFAAQNMITATNGNILVVGYLLDAITNRDFALARFHANGTVDTSFGTSGLVTTDFAGGDDWGNSVILQQDGKIVAAGNGDLDSVELVRYLANGTLDTSFAENGKVITSLGFEKAGIQTLALQSDGRIVAAGGTDITSSMTTSSSSDFLLLRYLPDGQLDPSFGQNGKVLTDFFPAVEGSIEVATSLAIQFDGKLIAAGHAVSQEGGFALARYHVDGSLDTSFAENGLALTTISDYEFDRSEAISLKPDGKIVAAGYMDEGLNYGPYKYIALAQYNSGLSSNHLSGSVLGMNEVKILCTNIDTSQRLYFPLAEYENSWNCQQAGLLAQPGERLVMRVAGKAN